VPKSLDRALATSIEALELKKKKKKQLGDYWLHQVLGDKITRRVMDFSA
jgi:hypothetical protein